MSTQKNDDLVRCHGCSRAVNNVRVRVHVRVRVRTRPRFPPTPFWVAERDVDCVGHDGHYSYLSSYPCDNDKLSHSHAQIFFHKKFVALP